MELIDIDDLEVLTESGFKSFNGIKKNDRDGYIHIFFNDETDLKCSYEHKIKIENRFIEACNLQVGCYVNDKIITDIQIIDKEIDLFDLLNVEDTNSYITNDVVSHNCAFVENWDEFYISTFNTMANSKKSKIALVSTPNGVNHFTKFWEGANEKDPKKNNGWYPVQVLWKDVPGRDEAWKQEILAGTNFDYEKFAQEHECSFIGSSGTLISGWRLKEMIGETIIPITFGNGMYQYELPKKGHQYTIVCDVSRGRGLDYSTMQVLDVTSMPYKQICTFKDNMITPLDFVETIFRTAKTYNQAGVLVEINDVGSQVSESLFYDFEYENVIMTQNHGRQGKIISTGFGSKEKDFGIRTTKTVKAIGCAMLKLLIEQHKLIINDRHTVDELLTFSKKNNSYEAESGNHDDLVMPLVLFGWMTDQQYFKELTDINTLHVLREKTEEQMMEELLPFGFIDDGLEDREPEEIKTVPSLDSWLFS